MNFFYHGMNIIDQIEVKTWIIIKSNRDPEYHGRGHEGKIIELKTEKLLPWLTA